MHYFWLKRKYPREYLELLAESAPGRLTAALEEREHEEAVHRRLQEEIRRREEAARADRLAPGGELEKQETSARRKGHVAPFSPSFIPPFRSAKGNPYL